MNGYISANPNPSVQYISVVRQYIMQEGSSVPTIDWWVVPVQLVIL